MIQFGTVTCIVCCENANTNGAGDRYDNCCINKTYFLQNEQQRR